MIDGTHSEEYPHDEDDEWVACGVCCGYSGGLNSELCFACSGTGGHWNKRHAPAIPQPPAPENDTPTPQAGRVQGGDVLPGPGGGEVRVTKSEPWHCVCGREFWEKAALVAHMDNCGVFDSDLKNPHAQLASLRRQLAATERRAAQAEGERDGLRNELAQAKDTEECLGEILNGLWGLLYPDAPASWEYPGQVLNHIRVELGRQRAALAGLGGAGKE